MQQARTSWADLGVALGISAQSAAERVHKLEERGVIKGYAALVDPQAVGCNLTAFIAVWVERPEQRTTFLAMTGNMSEILECHHVAGDYDYLLKVRCTGTQHLEQIITGLKTAGGVARSKTTVVLSTAKETPIFPVSSP
jgi:Lrp/AsnC family leucine-responsive transcriptional regulator